MKTITKYVSVKKFTHGGNSYNIGDVFAADEKKLNRTDLNFLLETERIKEFGFINIPDEEPKVDTKVEEVKIEAPTVIEPIKVENVEKVTSADMHKLVSEIGTESVVEDTVYPDPDIQEPKKEKKTAGRKPKGKTVEADMTEKKKRIIM